MFDDHDLKKIRRDISRLAKNEDQLAELMFLLNQTDWSVVFNNDCKICDACGENVPYSRIKWNVLYDVKICCLTCFQKTIDGYNRHCDRCGKDFFTRSIRVKDMCISCYTELHGKACFLCNTVYWPCFNVPVPICPSCVEKQGLDSNKENHKIYVHLGRAKSLGLPASLTCLEWLSTLIDFNLKCAYCNLGKYEVLDHFIPLSKKGGTIKGNCVPSCQSCNSKKGHSYPNEIATIPKSAIDHVQTYLDQFL